MANCKILSYIILSFFCLGPVFISQSRLAAQTHGRVPLQARNEAVQTGQSIENIAPTAHSEMPLDPDSASTVNIENLKNNLDNAQNLIILRILAKEKIDSLFVIEREAYIQEKNIAEDSIPDVLRELIRSNIDTLPDDEFKDLIKRGDGELEMIARNMIHIYFNQYVAHVAQIEVNGTKDIPTPNFKLNQASIEKIQKIRSNYDESSKTIIKDYSHLKIAKKVQAPVANTETVEVAEFNIVNFAKDNIILLSCVLVVVIWLLKK